MKNCLNENKIAECADWLLSFMANKPEDRIMIHVGHCITCKQEIIEITDLMLEIDLSRAYN